MLAEVLNQYGLKEELTKIEVINSGLINHTWKLTSGKKQYILQRVNSFVFKQPDSIAYNISLVAEYLKRNYPDYKFVSPKVSVAGDEMVYIKDEGYFRLFAFVQGSHTIDKVETPKQAFEAAAQFGRFTRLLSGMPASNLKITIPSFHDLALRYQQFLDSVKNGNQQRLEKCKELVNEIANYNDIVHEYQRIQCHPEFKLRVTHHDTKISNVLFDNDNNGICVIDLDTVMPGYFISDVGDMMRTFLCPVNEEEKDFDKIVVREEFYKAILDGYVTQMNQELTATEKKYFFYAAKFMIYMQAVRFITDYLNNDCYYTTTYPQQNFVRAGNQIALLKRLLEKESVLAELERSILNG